MAEQTRHERNAHHSGTEFIECAEVSEIPDEGVIAVNVGGNPLLWQKAMAKFSQWTIVVRTWAILLTVEVSTMAS